MNSTNSPIIDNFTRLVLKTIHLQKKYNLKKSKEIINADLIPRFSEDIIKPGLLKERTINPFDELNSSISKSELKKLSEKIKPRNKKPIIPKIEFPDYTKHPKKNQIDSDKFHASLTLPVFEIPRHLENQDKTKKNLAIPAKKSIEYADSPISSEYGKIELLLHDPTITLIECKGANKPISIIRAGKRQLTKIALNQEEIDNIIKNIAKEARIPLMEGIFRAAINNLVIHSIISNNLGLKFIIKKYTPYSMLEKKAQRAFNIAEQPVKNIK